jgi:hypothetical protein
LKAVSVVLARSAPAIKTASEVDASFGHVSVFVSSESTNLMREAIRRHQRSSEVIRRLLGEHEPDEEGNPHALREGNLHAMREAICMQ